MTRTAQLSLSTDAVRLRERRSRLRLAETERQRQLMALGEAALFDAMLRIYLVDNDFHAVKRASYAAQMALSQRFRAQLERDGWVVG